MNFSNYSDSLQPTGKQMKPSTRQSLSSGILVPTKNNQRAFHLLNHCLYVSIDHTFSALANFHWPKVSTIVPNSEIPCPLFKDRIFRV